MSEPITEDAAHIDASAAFRSRVQPSASASRMAAAPQQAEVKSPQRSQAEAEAPAPAKSKPVGVYKVLIDFSTPIGSQLVQFKSGYLILDPAMGAALQASGCPVAIDDKAKRVICPQCGHVHAFRLE